MGTNTENYRGCREALSSRLIALLCLAAVITIIQAVTDLDVGRTFILNPTYLTWEQAKKECQDMNGTLAKIDAVHVIPDMGYIDPWTLWIGLRVQSSQPRWEDGVSVSWSNWDRSLSPWTQGDAPRCVYAMTSPPWSWLTASCNLLLPSLCEVGGGTCGFSVTFHASLQSFNDKRMYMDTLSCLNFCRTTLELDCRSVENSRDADICQLSTENRWTQPRHFNTADRHWDYHHWTCINGTYLDGIYVTPKRVPLSSTATTTSRLPTTSTETPTTTQEEDEGETVCFKRKPITENVTKEVEHEVKELQSLTLVYKKQLKLKKKTTMSDTRDSATYVGSLAVGLVLTLLGLIVCSDLISLPRYIRQMNKKGAPCGRCVKYMKKRKLKKRNKIRFTEYSEQSPSRPDFGQFMVSTRLPEIFRPHEEDNVSYIEGTSSNRSETVSSLDACDNLDIHLERIRRLDKHLHWQKSSLSRPSTLDDKKTSSIETVSGDVCSVNDFNNKNSNTSRSDNEQSGSSCTRQEEQSDAGHSRDNLTDPHTPHDSNLSDPHTPHDSNLDCESGIGGSHSSDGSQTEHSYLREAINMLNAADIRQQNDFGSEPEHEIELTHIDPEPQIKRADDYTTNCLSFPDFSQRTGLSGEDIDGCDDLAKSAGHFSKQEHDVSRFDQQNNEHRKAAT